MSQRITYNKGDVIYLEGTFEMAMYVVKSGQVSVYANYQREDEMLLKVEGEGKYFGHLELIEAIPRSATVVAKEDTVLVRIEGDEFGSYFSSHPEEQMEILSQMSARLREIGRQLHTVYQTIDEYLSEEKKEDPSFLSRLSHIVTFGRSHRE